MTLRHNAYGEIPGTGHALYPGEGMVSFNLVNLFDELGIDVRAIANMTFE